MGTLRPEWGNDMSMKPMSWKEYYNGFYEWATATQIRYLARLSDVGPADEVVELALQLCDEKASDKLVRLALDRGVSFSFANVCDLDGSVSSSILDDAARSIRERVAEQKLADLEGVVADEVYIELLHRNGYKTEDEKEEEREAALERQEQLEWEAELERATQPVQPARRSGPRMGILGALFHMFAISEDETQRTGKSAWKTLTAGRSRRCGGDCTHCPPHYGYREGRWYYGHHHSYGCELGGNKRG